MDNTCKICNQLVSERSHFWKIHKIKEKDYYERYETKFDKLTMELIEFKNPEQYKLTDFQNKINLRKYLESKTKKEGLDYLEWWIYKRKELKNLIYSMGEFECKSLCFPSISYIQKKFGEDCYDYICSINKLILKYNYKQILETDNNKELNFICDSREQNLLKFPNVQISTLNYGDYSIENNNDRIFIERKSLTDAISSLSGGYERLNREIDRSKLDNGYLIFLIEEKYSNLQSFEYMPHIHSKCNWIFISHQIRELIQKYPLNIQFLAVDGRKEAVRVIEKIFRLKNNIRNIDLQFFYNKKDL